MTSEHKTETNLESQAPPYVEQPVRAETAYERLTSYAFARRYVKGKAVADIDLEGVGYGSRLLAETAESVAGLSSAPETADEASVVYSASNRSVELPNPPFSASSLDVVVAFGVVDELEHPEALLREARRVLKQDGVLLISAADRQSNTVERNQTDDANGRREMYVPEFQQMLERHFEHVRIYRHGAVAGGFVYPATGEEVNDTPMEVARFSMADHVFGEGSPVTRSVIAVCSDAAGVLAEEQPYLLLDRDRRVFDESEERAEDVELLRAEIWRMQETEIQAFIDTIKVRRTLIQELPRYLPHMRHILIEHLIHRRNIIRGNIYAIRKKGAIGLARGAFRRSSAFYRRLQARTRGSE